LSDARRATSPPSLPFHGQSTGVATALR
jgi:hypothetical protein